MLIVWIEQGKLELQERGDSWENTDEGVGFTEEHSRFLRSREAKNMKIYVGNLVMGSWEKSPDYFYCFLPGETGSKIIDLKSGQLILLSNHFPALVKRFKAKCSASSPSIE